MQKKTHDDAVGPDFAATMNRTHRHSDSSPEFSSNRSHRVENCLCLRTDTSGRITHVNSAAQSFFGKNAQELVGQKFAAVVLPRKPVSDRLEKRYIHNFIYHPDQDDRAEFETRHASGRVRRVVWVRTGLRDPAGDISEMLYIGISVHTLESLPAASAAVALSRTGDPPGSAPVRTRADCDLLEKIIDSARVWAWAWEEREGGVFTYLSPGICRTLQYSPDELIGASATILLSEEDHGRFFKAVEAARNKEDKQIYVLHRDRCKNGQFLWIETSGRLVLNEDGTVLGSYGFDIDVTALMTVKEELKRREQEYRYLFDNTQVGLFVTNEDFGVVNINQAGAAMYGSTRELMIGRPMTEFVPESDRKRLQKAYKRDFRQALSGEGRYVDLGVRMVRIKTDQGQRYLKMAPKAVKILSKGKMVALLATVMDVTESHVLQKELEKHQLHLKRLVDEHTKEIGLLQEEMVMKERMTTLGKLTATVSHEIRNPLGTINSSLYVINEKVKDKNLGITSAVERAMRAIRRCDGIIEELLDFTRTKHLYKKQVEIDSFIQEIIHAQDFPENVSVDTSIATGETLRIDPDRFQRCLCNILYNSLDALREKGGGEISLTARRHKEHVEIVVADTGIGIPKKEMNRVFEPLYSTKRSGMGLGLPICKQVVELHGGSIDIRSSEGKGTEVTLQLPISSREEPHRGDLHGQS